MGKRINIYFLKFIYLFIIGAFALVLVDVLQLRIPNIIGKIIDGLDEDTLKKSDLKAFVSDMIFIIIFMFIGRFLWRVAITGASHMIEADLKKKVYRHLLDLPVEYYVKNDNGALMSYFTSDAKVIRNYFGGGTLMVVDALFLGIYTFYNMVKLSLTLSLLCCIPLLIIAIVSGVLGHIMNLKFQENQSAYDDVSSFGEETFRGLYVFKAFARENIQIKRFKKINREFKNKNKSLLKTSIMLEVITEMLVWSVGAIVLGYGGYMAYQYKNGSGSFSVGDLTRFFSYFITINWPMFAVSRFIDVRSQAKASATRINKLLDERIMVKDKDNAIDAYIEGSEIEFRNFTFKYPDAKEAVLKNISLKIKKGDFIGVIGRTGSGKSSLFDCLLRFYNVDDGTLFIDGYDIMDVKISNVKRALGYVDQENFLFSDTISKNVSFFNDVDKDKVLESLKSSNVYDNVLKFPNKEETILGERGLSLSGGQKERIAISRALYKNPNVLILDDSLSAVDAKTEKDILKIIKEMRGDKITILSSNKISCVKHATKIVVLDKGMVMGVGSHSELIESCDIYKEIYNLQSLDGGDIDE